MVIAPTIRKYMTQWLIKLKPETDVFDAIDALVKGRASGAAVLNESGEIVGVLTEKDCLRVLSNTAWGQLAEGAVKDYMSPVRVTVHSDMDLFGVAAAFLGTNFTVLPVVDNGKLVGRISRQDMLKGILALNHQIEEDRVLEEQKLHAMQSPRSIQQMQQMVGSHRPDQVAGVMSNRHSNR